VSPDGSNNNSGATPTSGITLLTAAQVAVAGDVVCIEPGNYSLTSTFAPAHSGNPSDWITFTNYGTGVVNIVWAGAADGSMVHMYGSSFPNGPSYIQFNGLTLNGQNNAAIGFFCQGSHHLKFTYNTVEDMGSAGIASVDCDYLTADHNIVYHNGYNTGWSSGISFNSNQWFDAYTGLHNIVSNNMVAGNFDGSSYHTDGNGIIMDLSNGTYVVSSANTPPALIVNNVVYGNGGRCIQAYTVTNIWVVNNTCYDNDLDLTLGPAGGIVSNNSNTEVFVNNIVQSWDSHSPFQAVGTVDASTMIYADNLTNGGTNVDIPSTGFTTGDPDFIDPPAYNPTAGGQYANTISPSSLGTGLNLQSSSPAINAGIDPTSLVENNTNLKNDMSAYIYTDINGNARPVGGPFTLGAYQP
jgi:hypothetical protein